jgi:RNA polymerase sigma-B factor
VQHRSNGVVVAAPKSRDEAGIVLRAYRRTRDPLLRERLVREYLPLVRALARRYAGRGEPLDDLIQVGALGLLEAIDRFDPQRGESLATFAVPTITGRIRNHLRDRSCAVRVPRRLAQLSREVKRSRDEIAARLGRPPTLAELTRDIGAPREELMEALETEQVLAPLSFTAAEAARAEQPSDDPFRSSDDRILLAAGFRVLDQRERRILHLRFFAGLSQSEVAVAVGLSQVQVSRLISASLARMRAALREQPAARSTSPA